MENTNKKIGSEGENLAATHLKSLGYEILGRNVRIKHDEIDILAKDGNMLVFVEVKTRVSDSYGVPEDFVNYQKEQHMIRFAENYIYENDWRGESRFDIIAVHFQGRNTVLRHIEDAFYPSA